jgi:hypothetical protein
MRKTLEVTAFAVAASIWHCQPSFGYTQADCDQLKKSGQTGPVDKLMRKCRRMPRGIASQSHQIRRK